MTEYSSVWLRNVAGGSIVSATLIDGVTLGAVTAAQSDWRDFLQSAFGSATNQLEHGHWNWVRKARFALAHRDYRLVGIACAGQMQGLMLIAFHHTARLPGQESEPVVYIDYLSTAPWNLPGIAPGMPPQYGGVGRVLVAAALAESRSRGWDGRLGLHSLPQAERFYADVCGMTDLGIDSQYESLRYFEMTPEQAAAFEGGRS